MANKQKAETFRLFRFMIRVGTVIVLLGIAALLIDIARPIANINASIPGVSFSGTDLPAGIVLIFTGLSISVVFGWLSNDRVRAYGAKTDK